MTVVICRILIIAIVVTLCASRTAYCAPSNPFGNHTIDVANGPLLEKWLAISNKLNRDHLLLSACVDGSGFSCNSAQRLRDIIDDAKSQDGLAVIGHINRAINFAITPVERSDWLSPLEAINGDGDCKAYSITKYFALREVGIAADHLRLVIVRTSSGDHMVVAALWQDHWFILDNLTLTLVPDTLSDYVPLLVLDDKGMRGYVATTRAMNNYK